MTSRLDILCVSPAGVPIGVEIKTGEDPTLSVAQAYVYLHAILGAGVTSPDAKINTLGLPQNSALPAIAIFSVWSAGPGQDKRYLEIKSQLPEN